MKQPGLFSRYDDAPARGKKPPMDFPIPGVKEVRFSGDTYDPKYDLKRLTGQILRVYDAMRPGRWLTLDEIHQYTGDPPASVSAQLRHLRKPRFGRFVIEKRSRGTRARGLYEYRLLPPEEK